MVWFRLFTCKEGYQIFDIMFPSNAYVHFFFMLSLLHNLVLEKNLSLGFTLGISHR
jgi:hypothetical protein